MFLVPFSFDKSLFYATVHSMANRKTKKTENKVMTAEQVAQYVPANDIPQLQAAIGLGLDSTFKLAKQSGASIVGSAQTSSQVIPELKKK